MPSKLHNKITYVDNIRFDSKVESVRYQELKLLELAGEIQQLKVHPVYLLQEKFKHEGKWIRAITYIGDFEYIENASGLVVCEDVKGRGVVTDVFRLKAKLFQHNYPEIAFRIIWS